MTSAWLGAGVELVGGLTHRAAVKLIVNRLGTGRLLGDEDPHN
jgi:hypothetical protein